MPYDTFERALEAVRPDGLVDYEALVAASSDLERFVTTLAIAGPTRTPWAIDTYDERLAFYINAYNALTLVAVVRAWPIDSVHDVRGPVSPKDGFGFFWAQRFVLDGERVHLYGLEHRILRGEFADARIHAAINCASVGCPALATEPYRPETLHAQLDAASRRFASPPHVVVDADAREIRLSSIYDWFAEDFERDARRAGWGETALDWVAHYAEPSLTAAIESARGEGFSVVHTPYDWGVNAVSAAAQ